MADLEKLTADELLAVAAALEDERERCAKIAEGWPVSCSTCGSSQAQGIAARIREGGEPKECICNAGFGMNLSCPIHGPKEAHPNG